MKIVLGIICLFFLMSCQNKDDPSDIFENYLYRLSNSLDFANNQEVDIAGVNTALVRYPSLRDLSLDVSLSKINLMEFLRLSQCDLQRLLGERNSSLGKLKKPSQTLLYEYTFLELASLCLDQLDNTSKLHSVIQNTLSQKQQQLPLNQWNAIFASEEFAHQFSLGSSALSYAELNLGQGDLLSALDLLAAFVNQDVREEPIIEGAYSVVGSSKRVGELRLSMSMAAAYLNEADKLLKARLGDKPLCYKQRPNRQFDIVNNVFTTFYIKEVQSYLAILNQQADTLFKKLNNLTSDKIESDSFALYWDSVYRSDKSEWVLFNRAIQLHTKNWQGLLKQCGRLPL